MRINNRPPHLYLDRHYYFVTSRVIRKQSLFNTDEKKTMLLDVIQLALKKFSCDLVAWVILSNHYHLFFKLPKGMDLRGLVSNIHVNSARLLNKLDETQGRKVWWNYWDHGIRSDADFWKHFNYIHHNPVKHGYAKEMAEYTFSSYSEWVKRKGADWPESCFAEYPIADFTGAVE